MHSVLKEEGHPVAVRQTLIAKIEGSIGSSQYLSLYITLQGEGFVTYQDVIGYGSFACAYYVSALLHLMSLSTDAVHTNVTETEQDLIASGWKRVETPEPGAVIIWGPKLASDGVRHRHIGFSLGNDRAVSTDGTTGKPTEHNVTYGMNGDSPIRPIEAIYWHERLRS